MSMVGWVMVDTATVRAGKAATPVTIQTPDAGSRAAVVVLQEIWGVTDHVLGQARSLADHGFTAVVPHLYHRWGAPVLEWGDFAAGKALLRRLNGPELALDLDAAVEQARDLGAGTIGALGFCLGGSVALWAAGRLDIDAAVTFYGSGITEPRWVGVAAGLATAAELDVPWLGLYGDRDTGIPTAEVEELRAVLADRPVPTEIIRYPQAGHAFATDPRSPLHVAAAAADGWARAVTWFDAHLDPARHLDPAPHLPGPGRPVG